MRVEIGERGRLARRDRLPAGQRACGRGRDRPADNGVTHDAGWRDASQNGQDARATARARLQESPVSDSNIGNQRSRISLCEIPPALYLGSPLADGASALRSQKKALVAELADAYGSGPYGVTRGGSNPLESIWPPAGAAESGSGIIARWYYWLTRYSGAS